MKTLATLFFAICVAGGVMAPSGSLAADKKKKKSEPEEPRKSVLEKLQDELRRRTQPAPAPGVRSEASSTPVRLRLTNLTGGPVDLVWVNPAGGQQSYGQLPAQIPGEGPAMIDTYVGHVWLFKSGGRVLQTYTATGGRQQQVVLGGGNSRAPVVVDLSPPVTRNQPPGSDLPPAPRGGVKVPAVAVEFLQIHNDTRARVGVARLRWSDALARHAQEWADHLASTGTFQHRDASKTGYGENLFGGSDGFGPADAARHWLKERAVYRGGPITPQNFQSVGHYTQMVWSETTEVGYGMARGRNGLVIIVGNYFPGGNLTGQKPY